MHAPQEQARIAAGDLCLKVEETALAARHGPQRTGKFPSKKPRQLLMTSSSTSDAICVPQSRLDRPGIVIRD